MFNIQQRQLHFKTTSYYTEFDSTGLFTKFINKTIFNNTCHKMKLRNFSTSYNLLAKSIDQVIQYSTTKCFTFSYEILNAPCEKITFLWNFCHLFLVLFYKCSK